MSWLRLEGLMPHHRKVAPLSDAAFRLHVTAMAWCVEERTDGKVPKNIPPTLPACPRGRPLDAAIRELSKAGLWLLQETDEVWCIHDFLSYNPSAAQAAAVAAARSASGKAGGKRSAEAKQTAKQTLEQNGMSGADDESDSFGDGCGSAIFGSLLLLPLSWYISFADGYVLSRLWQWYAVPGGLNPVTWQAFAAACMAYNLITAKIPRGKDDMSPRENGAVFAIHILRPWVILAIAWWIR